MGGYGELMVDRVIRRYLIEKKREEGRVEKWGELVGEIGDDGCRMERG